MSLCRGLSLVIPVFNESQALPLQLSFLEKWLSTVSTQQRFPIEVIYVDDSSSDNSAEIIQRHGQFRFLKNSQVRGYGSAIKTGVEASSYDWILIMDADMTYDPSDLLLSIESNLSDSDFLINGNRLRARNSGMPLLRYLGNHLLWIFFKWQIGTASIMDPCSGMKCFSKSSVMPFTGLLANDLGFAYTLSCLAQLKGWAHVEVPISYQARIGESKLSEFRDGFSFVRSFLKIKSALFNAHNHKARETRSRI